MAYTTLAVDLRPSAYFVMELELPIDAIASRYPAPPHRHVLFPDGTSRCHECGATVALADVLDLWPHLAEPEAPDEWPDPLGPVV